VKTPWGVALRDLINAELSGFAAQVSVNGIPIVLGGAFTQQFALVLHELAKNAAKYGALSTPNGRMLIAWRWAGEKEPTLLFSWKERDGPPVEPPMEQGFGSKLIAATVPGSRGFRSRAMVLSSSRRFRSRR
jgi:two-component system, chemotaxis family, CheB/CheR fusion protein